MPDTGLVHCAYDIKWYILYINSNIATCIDTLDPLLLLKFTFEVGIATASTKDTKQHKYGTIGKNSTFETETLTLRNSSVKCFCRDSTRKLLTIMTKGLLLTLLSKLAMS